MTDLRNQKRLAAAILKCGEGRVWIDPDRTEDVAGAVTRSDVRRLISGGAIQRKAIVAQSRARTRHAAAQREKGRRRGHGSRKGAKFARLARKARWIRLIRPLREELRGLKKDGKITPSTYRLYYRRAKGGQFRSRAHLLAHMKTERAIQEGK